MSIIEDKQIILVNDSQQVPQLTTIKSKGTIMFDVNRYINYEVSFSKSLDLEYAFLPSPEELLEELISLFIHHSSNVGPGCAVIETSRQITKTTSHTL